MQPPHASAAVRNIPAAAGDLDHWDAEPVPEGAVAQRQRTANGGEAASLLLPVTVVAVKPPPATLPVSV